MVYGITQFNLPMAHNLDLFWKLEGMVICLGFRRAQIFLHRKYSALNTHYLPFLLTEERGFWRVYPQRSTERKFKEHYVYYWSWWRFTKLSHHPKRNRSKVQTGFLCSDVVRLSQSEGHRALRCLPCWNLFSLIFGKLLGDWKLI